MRDRFRTICGPGRGGDTHGIDVRPSAAEERARTDVRQLLKGRRRARASRPGGLLGDAAGMADARQRRRWRLQRSDMGEYAAAGDRVAGDRVLPDPGAGLEVLPDAEPRL